MAIPRSEYPRPQMVRNDWLCLNGPWQFERDPGDSGLERGLCDRPLSGEILVPFCPESSLSGIGDVDFHNAVWYRREVEIPSDWAGRDVLLHFQAVDYDATVWVNGVEIARHRGGFTPVSCRLAGVAGPGEKAVIVVRARDDHRQRKPAGKQCTRYANHGCHYTRTTGIWQTVWMEPVARRAHLLRPRITPDLSRGCFEVVAPLAGQARGLTLEAEVGAPWGSIASATAECGLNFAPRLTLEIPQGRRRPWSPDDPHLYDIHLRLRDERGEVIDAIRCYGGLRGIAIDGMKVLLNRRSVFQRLVLAQGYWPDGLMTAPTDEALVRDIELAKEAGFNGARLHQKVFEERFLYHADRMGYLVWGEFGDWPWSTRPAGNEFHAASVITQWIEAVQRDYNHPSIVGWCPLNESIDMPDDTIHIHDDVMRGMFLATKAADATRPVLDTSGWSHRLREADIYDSHNYTQDPVVFAATYPPDAEGNPHISKAEGRSNSVPYAGQPYFVSEFGGIWWQPDAPESTWGYGERPKSLEEFYSRFEGLCRVLLDNPNMFGYCYTQLTDVFQEANGVVAFDRSGKLDLARLRAAQQRPAAIEQ